MVVKFHKNGIENLDRQRSTVQDKLDHRLPNPADTMRKGPFTHHQKTHDQFKSKGLKVDF